MAINAKQFVKLLRKSGVINQETLDGWLAENKSDDVKTLAKKLISENLLTRWQAKYLLGGKHKLKFGSYVLLERLQHDPIGHRFLGFHKKLDRRVDLLFLSSELCKESTRLRELIKKVGAAAEVDHPNLERVYDIDRDDKRYYLVTEHMDGHPVEELAANEQLTSRHIAAIARQTVLALTHAHEKGVTHGGLSAGDMMLDKNRQLKIRNIVQSFLARNLNQESNLTTTLPQDDWESLRGITTHLLKHLPEKRAFGDCDALADLLNSINTDSDFQSLTTQLESWIQNSSQPTKASTPAPIIPAIDTGEDSIDPAALSAPNIDLGDADVTRPEESFSGLAAIGGDAVGSVDLPADAISSDEDADGVSVDSVSVDAKADDPPKAKKANKAKKASPKRKKRKSRKAAPSKFKSDPKIFGIASVISLLLLGVLGYSLGLFSSESDTPTAKQTTNNSSQTQPADDIADVPSDEEKTELTEPGELVIAEDEESFEDQLNNSFDEESELDNDFPSLAIETSTPNESSTPKPLPVAEETTQPESPDAGSSTTQQTPTSPATSQQLPFDDLAASTDLPLADDTNEKSLGTVHPYRNTALQPTLLWDTNLSPGKTNFAIKKAPSNQIKWNITGKIADADESKVAQLEFRDEQIFFTWLPAAAEFRNANYLRNGVLQLEFPGQKRKLRLRKPVVIDGFAFASDKPEIESEIEIDWLPSNVATTLSDLNSDIYGELFFAPESKAIDRRKGLRIAMDAVAEDRIVSILLKSDVRKKLKLSGSIEIQTKNGRYKTATTERLNEFRKSIESLLQAKTKEHDMFKDAKIAEIREFYNDDSIKDKQRDEYVKQLKEEMGIAESRLKSIDGYAKRLENFYNRPVPVSITYELAGEQIVIASTWDADVIEQKIEGEDLQVISKTRGTIQQQSKDGVDWSGERQLLWRDAKVGSKLQLEFTIAKKGKYEIVAHLSRDRDYGKHRITINGQPLASEIDVYSKFLVHENFAFGTFDLNRGSNSIEVEVTGANSAANPRHKIGIDYLQIKSASE